MFLLHILMQKQKLKLQHLDSEALIKNSQVEGEVYLNKLNQKISILNTIKNQKNIKRLQTSLTNQILQEKTALQYYRKNKSFTLKNTTRLSKQNIIVYVININLTRTNTLITITDIKGNVKLFYSAGQVNLKGKQKTKQPTALINILKSLTVKAKFLRKNPVALHFKNTMPHYESFIIKMLKSRFFIKTIRNYNLQPHNGCRPKKLKRF